MHTDIHTYSAELRRTVQRRTACDARVHLPHVTTCAYVHSEVCLQGALLAPVLHASSPNPLHSFAMLVRLVASMGIERILGQL